ncbi:unnamed protein product [Arabis nemorensis]|uniref:Uncharacterized protein n=1 Tax=Arabis nemorensis TaxID=586526 RepID=A0A565AVK1_9BRAS|nr:unnamed protein product [Arabis nemorensis]
MASLCCNLTYWLVKHPNIYSKFHRTEGETLGCLLCLCSSLRLPVRHIPPLLCL